MRNDATVLGQLQALRQLGLLPPQAQGYLDLFSTLTNQPDQVMGIFPPGHTPETSTARAGDPGVQAFRKALPIIRSFSR